MELRIKEYTLTDGVNDYVYRSDFSMTEKQADKIVELINAWRNQRD